MINDNVSSVLSTLLSSRKHFLVYYFFTFYPIIVYVLVIIAVLCFTSVPFFFLLCFGCSKAAELKKTLQLNLPLP